MVIKGKEKNKALRIKRTKSIVYEKSLTELLLVELREGMGGEKEKCLGLLSLKPKLRDYKQMAQLRRGKSNKN